MAETKRMTAEEVVGYLLEGEGLDFLRESLAWVCQQLMEAEVSGLIGAERGEQSPERLTHRNGYRQRPWHTRAAPSSTYSRLRWSQSWIDCSVSRSRHSPPYTGYVYMTSASSG